MSRSLPIEELVCKDKKILAEKKSSSADFRHIPVFVLSVKRVMLSEVVKLSEVVMLKFSLSQTGLHRDELLSKFRWRSPGAASRADSVVKMVGRKKMAMREVRRTMVLTRVERLSRPRSSDSLGPNTEGVKKEVSSEKI